MKEHLSEIIITATGVMTTASAWMLGGRQKSKNETRDTLTRGADQLVDTSKKLLKIAEEAAKAERERTHECQKKLAELRNRVECLEKKLNNNDNNGNK